MDLVEALKQMLSRNDGDPSPLSPRDDRREVYVSLDSLRPIRNESDWYKFLQKLGIFAAPPEIDWRDPYVQPSNVTSRPIKPTQSTRDASLADQFTWGSVVCAAVFIVVFVCVMSAWWFHKKRRQSSERRQENLERRRADALAPFQLDNSVRTLPSTAEASQRPPSYFDVVAQAFELPPSYNEAVVDKHAYDNIAITIEEPPPFYEESKPQEESQQQTTAVTTCPTTATVSIEPELNAVCSTA